MSRGDSKPSLPAVSGTGLARATDPEANPPKPAPADDEGQEDGEPAPASQDATRWLERAHPSWHRRVLTVLARDYPGVCEDVWSTAITENAIEQTTRRRP